jgi:hypothetical protein
VRELQLQVADGETCCPVATNPERLAIYSLRPKRLAIRVLRALRKSAAVEATTLYRHLLHHLGYTHKDLG